ncbi:Putative 2-hydroxyacid dehydrogenase [Neomoorella glycerini]|uniref:2-hydroxyacid dehydrogenase n=1 Tax=Neomoorella glycerini TaxID=55779 RepID=A0A6I5ZMA1_9FIRM|nr:NAD(P)-dependent oxidoreductase [Moorella glycerini]QGP90988.1 Putative 2-hydroxyacid dehydrogenase [Moorella glycerini]
MHIGLLSKSPNTIQVLEKELAEHHLVVIQNKEQLLGEVESLEILVTSSMGFPLNFVNREIFEKARRLQLIQHFGVAADVVDLSIAQEFGVPVANVPGLNTVAVAELGIYLIFALARRARLAAQMVEEKRLGEPVGTEVAGKTLGVVGLGRIGTALALRVKGLGMRVLAVTENPTPGLARALGIELVQTPEYLIDLLAQSDYVVLTLPLNEKTVGLIGPRELAAMRPGAYLINLSRGPLIDREALLHALQSGRLGGFATDAAWEEPADPNDCIFTQPNVILTPHIGATTREVLEATARVVRENVDRVARGEKPLYMLT